MTTQPAFKPIEIKITTESEEELHNLWMLSSLSADTRADIRAVLDDNGCVKKTEQNIQDFLEKLSELIIAFEDDNDLIVGSSVRLRSQGVFADFSFNGEKFTRVGENE